ncbi:unnamed protein product, partial [Staurois parvus]
MNTGGSMTAIHRVNTGGWHDMQLQLTQNEHRREHDCNSQSEHRRG